MHYLLAAISKIMRAIRQVEPTSTQMENLVFTVATSTVFDKLIPPGDIFTGTVDDLDLFLNLFGLIFLSYVYLFTIPPI